VAQCFVFGDSYQPVLVAVAIPDEEVVKNWAKQNGKEGDFKTLCQDKQLNKVILDSMVQVGKEAKINSFEIIKAIYLDHQLWSIDNNILTPTFKLKRPECKTKYLAQIQAMYDNIVV